MAGLSDSSPDVSPGISPDTKDWTWVLRRPCPECGFDASTTSAGQVPGLLREVAAAWPAELDRPDVRERPDSSTWAPLEYAAHVRDVLGNLRTRLALLLGEDGPTFPDWDQDAAAGAGRYLEQDPAVVATEIRDAAEAAARDLEQVPDADLDRAGRRSDGADFTVDSLARYMAHDVVHHLHDVRRAGS